MTRIDLAANPRTAASRGPDRFQPAGAIAATLDRRMVGSTALPAGASGTLRLTALPLNAGDVITSATFLAGTAGTAVIGRWFALYSPLRSLLAVTADDASAWAGNALKTLALSYTAPADGLYYLGICEVATVTTALRGATSTASALNIAPALNGDSSSGLTTAATAPATAAATTGNSGQPYAYVS